MSARPPPRAITDFVLKVHSRCDLACDHCYIYRHADQSWAGQPMMIAPETVRAAASRIAEHAATHRLRRVRVVLHGGEPLLLGADGLRAVLSALRTGIAPAAELDLRMQTNGVLLTAELCDLLVEFGVGVGVSLDGGRAANDRHRRFASGASSYPQVLRGLALLRSPAYRRAYAGILCTIDVRNDPIEVYEALLAQEPPRLDLLLPHATWDRPPPGSSAGRAVYARWLGAIYDRWLGDGRPVPIRLFDSLISTACGGPSGTETVGLDPVDYAVIETDGGWELTDLLKTAYPGAGATGLTVFAHPADRVAEHPGIAARRAGVAGLSGTCRACPVVARCGGGLYAHRFRSGSGFANPSVYCADLKDLIARVDRNPPPAGPLGAVPEGVLDDLATGYGGPGTIDFLVRSQLALTRVLVAAVGGRLLAGRRWRDTRLRAATAHGWERLGEVEAAAPEAVAAVLAHPFVRSWATHCLNEPHATDRDVAYLANLAAAAAVRAGVDAELILPLREGRLFLPTLGGLHAGPGAGDTAVLSVAGGRCVARTGRDSHPIPPPGGGRPSGRWRATHRIPVDGVEVSIEDADPFRGRRHWPVDGRQSATALSGWGTVLAGAARWLRAELPRHSPALRHVLRAITPLRPGSTGAHRGAGGRHAFGAVGVATGTGSDPLAALLVHELQRAKLGAVLDQADLVDPACPGRVTVGWRPDPRSPEPALTEIYARLGVADVWRRRAGERSGSSAGAEAAGAFAEQRGQVLAAIHGLRGTGALTGRGTRFVGGLQRVVESW